MMKTLAFFLMSCLTAPLWAANCPAGRPSIYFGNGVNVNLQDALNEAYDLQQAVLSKFATSQSVDPACFDFKLSYDSKFLDSNNVLIQLYNLELQVAASSGAQVYQQFLSQAWLWFADLNSAPTWFKQTIANVLQSGTIVFQPDLQTQVLNYNQDITNGNKVILVAHSQGNLYGNQAYAALLSPQPSEFSLISVATPAGFVAGNGPYVTLINDIITLVPNSLPGNTSNFPSPGGPCSSSVNLFTRLACHAFDTSYLVGINSGPAIVSDTIAAIPIVLGVSKLGPGTGSITSVQNGISCDSSCTSMQAAFPNGPSVTLTAAADMGSIFMGWSGDCAVLASGGVTDQRSISFPVFYDPSGAVIKSYPESCTATFNPGGILTVTKSGTGTGTVSSTPAGINCGPACATQNAPFPATPPVQLTATAANGSSFAGWGGDCAAAGTNAIAQVTLTSDKTCAAAFGSANPAVRLNPFGNQTVAGPYNVEVVNSNLVLAPAPQDITVTLLREVISQCSGLLFSSNRSVVVPQGQSSASYDFNAGHDPACNTLPITTRYTITQAVLGTNTVLDLSGAPAQRLVLIVTR